MSNYTRALKNLMEREKNISAKKRLNRVGLERQQVNFLQKPGDITYAKRLREILEISAKGIAKDKITKRARGLLDRFQRLQSFREIANPNFKVERKRLDQMVMDGSWKGRKITTPAKRPFGLQDLKGKSNVETFKWHPAGKRTTPVGRMVQKMKKTEHGKKLLEDVRTAIGKVRERDPIAARDLTHTWRLALSGNKDATRTLGVKLRLRGINIKQLEKQ